MEDGAIPDTKITASSWTLENPPHKARLYSNFPYSGGAWCPYKAAGSYLQVDLGALHHVTAVATQGNPSDRGGYVTQFTIQHSTDGQKWCSCEDKGTVKVNQLMLRIRLFLVMDSGIERYSQGLRIISGLWGRGEGKQKILSCSQERLSKLKKKHNGMRYATFLFLKMLCYISHLLFFTNVIIAFLYIHFFTYVSANVFYS